MKIIDILNKMANGEEPPKKIMYDGRVFYYVDEYKDYEYFAGGYCLFSDEFENHYGITAYLNDEVEILETTITYKPDKIEKIDLEDTIQNDTDLGTTCKIINKINEIIEVLNER